MQYLLTEEEYEDLTFKATFGPSNGLCEHCGNATDPGSIAATCQHLRGFVDVSRATGVMFIITKCDDFIAKPSQAVVK